eukprot:CAMPEP_0174710524 /NCGR_PEP_ID=MMETSP1094-20130205/12138_1 /TAXON_ID=156173 /ORGANISM="Chrysochromulina brevifilum, Strain UTEX LB 985" /LENGTH=141 /DNA_ID=CAMNT_0015909343 /DNA_START=239 /DNA_END=665 /DNA_ORIENTATION=-
MQDDNRTMKATWAIAIALVDGMARLHYRKSPFGPGLDSTTTWDSGVAPRSWHMWHDMLYPDESRVADLPSLHCALVTQPSLPIEAILKAAKEAIEGDQRRAVVALKMSVVEIMEMRATTWGGIPVVALTKMGFETVPLRKM